MVLPRLAWSSNALIHNYMDDCRHSTGENRLQRALHRASSLVITCHALAMSAKDTGESSKIRVS